MNFLFFNKNKTKGNNPETAQTIPVKQGLLTVFGDFNALTKNHLTTRLCGIVWTATFFGGETCGLDRITYFSHFLYFLIYLLIPSIPQLSLLKGIKYIIIVN
jgi:hypothetical protein